MADDKGTGSFYMFSKPTTPPIPINQAAPGQRHAVSHRKSGSKANIGDELERELDEQIAEAKDYYAQKKGD